MLNDSLRDTTYHRLDIQNGGATPSQKHAKTMKYAFIFAVLIAIGLAIALIAVVIHNKKGSDKPFGPDSLSDDVIKRIDSFMDTSVDPCDNFYDYACGNFMKEHAKEENYVASFSEIGAVVYQQEIAAILFDKFPFLSSYFNGCNDTAKLDKNGVTNDLMPMVNAIQRLRTLPDVFTYLGGLHAQGLSTLSLFSAGTQQEMHYGTTYVNYLQNICSVPLDAYIQNSNWIPLIFQALGVSAAESTKMAQDVINLQVQLTRLCGPIKTVDDLIANTVVMPTSTIANDLGLPIMYYLSALKASPNPSTDAVSVVDVQYFQRTATVLQATNMSIIQNYLIANLIIDQTNFLAEPFRSIPQRAQTQSSEALQVEPFPSIPTLPKETNIFRAAMKNLAGSTRERFCFTQTINDFSDLVSHLWIDEDYDFNIKDMATRLVDQIHDAAGKRINSVTWLTSETRAQAIRKWSYIVKNVGYSDDWYTYDGVAVRGVPFLDHAAVTTYVNSKQSALYGTTVDRNIIQSHDYYIQNAFYNPTTNSINMIAGLQLFPMLSKDLPMLLNFASYGMVIGHEITHGFDNSGRLYNGTGAYVGWWDKDSDAAFRKRATCLVNQYSQYTIDNGQTVDGNLTLGENIADHGGIRLAWMSYQNSAVLDKQLHPRMTNDKLYFLWYAQNWCTVQSLAFQKRQLANVHSPDKWRVIGPLSNFEPFAATYQCSAQSKMGRSLTDAKCEIW